MKRQPQPTFATTIAILDQLVRTKALPKRSLRVYDAKEQIKIPDGESGIHHRTQHVKRCSTETAVFLWKSLSPLCQWRTLRGAYNCSRCNYTADRIVSKGIEKAAATIEEHRKEKSERRLIVEGWKREEEGKGTLWITTAIRIGSLVDRLIARGAETSKQQEN